MKTLIVISVFCFYVVHLSSATSPTISIVERIKLSVERCITELKLDGSKIRPLVDMKKPLPEDDEDFTKFIICCWKDMHIINDDNEIDEVILTSTVMQSLEEKFSLTADKAAEISKLSVDKCKDIHEDCIGLKIIKRANCIHKETTKAMAS